MKKKSASQSAFFNLRLLTGLFLVLIGVFLALAGLGTFSAQAQQKKPKFIIAPELGIFSPGFDCSQIHEKGLDMQENFRAGGIMIACGESQGGSADADGGADANATSSGSAVSKLIQSPLIQSLSSPLFIGGGDVDVVIPETVAYPKVTQSESMEWSGPNNTSVVNYNDSRTSGGCYAGLSYSTDNGVTWHESQPLCTGHGTNFGDPIVVYNANLGLWFAGDLATGCGGQGIGMWTSPDGITWTPGACAVNTSQGDRESMWVDNNAASPHYGRMYISYNDFAIGGGALRVVYSDNGTTWTPVTLNGAFIRDVQVTGDLGGSGRVYVAAMDELGGSLTTRQNVMYRSTDGGATWASSNTGPAFPAVGRANCTANTYFVCMFGTNSWRHMGWGQPTANGTVVSLDYAQKGAGSDLGDVYYVRSTDSGVTWGTPVKLNTDSGTAMQWQPSMATTQAGAIFASWYDQREVNGGADLNCTAGSASNCYRRWGRVSFDNGATWQADDQVGRALSPLPGQPDSSVQPNYQGDYDYHSSFGTNIIGGWTDGRVLISGASQQDVFVNFVQGGFGVTSSVPACGSIISTQPVDFVVNLSDAVNTATVAAGDFTVNGTPSNLAPTFAAGDTQITFHYTSTPVLTQGLQTMHIPAGAFNKAVGGDLNADFTCTFRYDATLLMVTTTVPAVGGVFTPPAPGSYQYDVNWNEAVDPASVQTTDLTLGGTSGGNVTGVSVINANMTTRFTLNLPFGGTLTANIAAGAITDQFTNPGAAFSGNYTVQGCPPQDHYNIAQIGGSIVPGTTDIGNHADDLTTNVVLPFSYNLYGTTYTSINVSSNGNAQFTTTDTAFTNVCPLPWTTHNSTIFPYWDDQRTDTQTGCAAFPGGVCGIFTSITGSAPNRIFNIEWRTVYFSSTTSTANHELRLYEGQSRFDVIYGTVALGNSSATAGVQRDNATFDSYFCNASGGAATGGQSYILQTCAAPLAATSAVSRKVHGGFGPFDIPLPLSGSPGIECRGPGGGTNPYQVVVSFANPIVSVNGHAVPVPGDATLTGTGSVSAITIVGSTVVVDLTGVATQQQIGLTLTNVSDGTSSGDIPVPMIVLVGDSAGTGNNSVNSGDIAFVKSKAGAAVIDGTNFRADIAVSGTINASDISLVKSKSGNQFP